MRKYVIMCFLSSMYILIGEMLIFLLADQHALGNTSIYPFFKSAYYIIGVIILIWTVKMIYRKGFHRNKKELIIDYLIYIVIVLLVYTLTNMIIDKYLAHLMGL